MDGLFNFIDKIGFAFFAIIVLAVVIAIILLLQKLLKNNEGFQKHLLKLKAKLMWASVLRSIV